MKITDEAKVIIENALKEQDTDSIRLSLKETETGTGLSLELIKKTDNDRVVDVNGVNVVMDIETEMNLLSIVFAENNGELVLQTESSCGGSCAGCAGGCH
ncbi:MAG: hypothetical protein GYA87_09210 [Christensenellaceae bacterium]|nr:hypothetical protein [Christensenellaceae bacterium]